MTTLVDKIKTLITPSIEALGCQLWGVVYQGNGGGRAVLKVFIEAENGVSIEVCEKVSRQISSVMDAENPIQTGYILEVSSPGIDRLLFEPEQYKKYIDKEIKVKLFEALEGKRNFTGKVIDVTSDGQLKLDVAGTEHLFPLTKIQTAQVVF